MQKLAKQISVMLEEQQDALAEHVVTLQYERQPGQWERYGENGRKLSIRDMKYHFQYLTESISVEEPSLFADYIDWVKTLFDNLNLPADALLMTLECTRDVFKTAFPHEMMEEINIYLHAGIERLHHKTAAQDSYLEEEGELAGLAKAYIDALLQGERHRASQLILEAVKNGASIKAIYLDVFQRSQYEIGRLWMTNHISVAQEHYCTAATQLIMSQLYPYIFSTEKIGRRLIATCIGGELHEIGMRMVTDFFEMDGWDTYYMGANTPTNTILQTLDERQPDILGISATMTFHIQAVEDLIARVREKNTEKPLKILVGGYPFLRNPELWQKVGADGFGANASEAIQISQCLLS